MSRRKTQSTAAPSYIRANSSYDSLYDSIYSQEPPRRRHNSHHQRASMYTVNPLLTPPEDCYSPGAQQQRQQQQQDMSYMGTDDVTSPSEAYSKMSLAEKVREANQALVYTWGKMLVGMGVSELCENAALLRNIQLISLDDLPKNFCISPVDEFICPSDDAARVIVIVSDAGIVVDTGMYDMDGPIFYRGFVVDNQYLPTSASKRTFIPDQELN